MKCVYATRIDMDVGRGREARVSEPERFTVWEGEGP